MAYTYLVTIIKSFMQTIFLNCGTAISSWVVLPHWMQRKLSRLVMSAGNLSCRAWLIDTQAMSLMLDVASKGNIPLKNITGFSQSNGVWYIRLKNIGWLRTSDILQMAIEVYPQLEEVT